MKLVVIIIVVIIWIPRSSLPSQIGFDIMRTTTARARCDLPLITVVLRFCSGLLRHRFRILRQLVCAIAVHKAKSFFFSRAVAGGARVGVLRITSAVAADEGEGSATRWPAIGCSVGSFTVENVLKAELAACPTCRARNVRGRSRRGQATCLRCSTIARVGQIASKVDVC